MWMKEFEKWLRDLRTHFYDFIEGWVGPEGDPLRANLEPSRGRVACAENSGTNIRSELTSAAFQDAAPVAKVSEAWDQLPLL